MFMWNESPFGSLGNALRQNGTKYVSFDFSGSTATSIGSSAFFGCTSLTGITIPDSVTWIGGSAFRGCTSLTSVTFATGSNIDSDYLVDDLVVRGFSMYAFLDEDFYRENDEKIKVEILFSRKNLHIVYFAASTKAGTYKRARSGSEWTKQ